MYKYNTFLDDDVYFKTQKKTVIIIIFFGIKI